MRVNMKILWANFYCLLDTSSGASISVSQILSELKSLGHDIRILGATIFDSDKGVSKFGDNWARIKKIETEKFVDIVDGNLKHTLLITKSTERKDLTQGELGVWIQRYRHEIQYFKPDFIFFYGGGPGDIIPAEARAWNIPCGAYLVNGTFDGHRWCRDIDTFITDTVATRDYYRNKLNINPFPIKKFIGRDKVAKYKKPERLLYVNPSLSKGATLVIMMARLLERIKPEIKIEIVESRGDWNVVLNSVNNTIGMPEGYCPSNIIVTPNSSDMATIYSRAKVLFVPSLWWESGARVIAEAQLNGIPVVATNRGGNPEMVGSGGILFSLPEICYEKPYLTTPTEQGLEPIAKKIITLFEDKDYYDSLSIAALRNAEITSNSKNNAKTLESHIKELVTKKQTWSFPQYTKPAYPPFNSERIHGEENIYEPLNYGINGIFIDCGGYDGCSATKFILNNPHFTSVTFEPNPELWSYYEKVPTFLIKKGVAGKTEKREFTIDEIDGDGSSFVSGKQIDYKKTVPNDKFKKISIECIDIAELISGLNDADKIILKLDVEGAEYEILNQLLATNQIKKIDKIYIEWHWHKIGMSYEDHIDLFNRIKKHCDIREWDALDMAVHQRDPERVKSRNDLINSVLGSNLEKYKNNCLDNKIGG